MISNGTAVEKADMGLHASRRSNPSPLKWLAAALALLLACAPVLAEARQSGRAIPEPSAEILIDAASGRVLVEKDADVLRPPASMAKMMVMLLVAEAVQSGRMKWTDPIRASLWASKMGGSQVYLSEGEVFPLAEMMQAVIIHSANDAAVAVAEALSGSVDAFVRQMNERARRLGMEHTVFRTPHGLPPSRGQEPDVTTARDMATLARAVIRFPQTMEWAGTTEAPFRNGKFRLTNTNRLVLRTNWIDGLKTGYHSAAGFNITATAERDGLRLIAVVMGMPQKRDSFDGAERLLRQGFAEYKTVFAVRKGDVVANDVPVKAGQPRFVRVVAGDDLRVLAGKHEERSFDLELLVPRDLHAPIAVSDTVGQVIVTEGSREVGKVPALAAEAVQRQSSLWERLF